MLSREGDDEPALSRSVKSTRRRSPHNVLRSLFIQWPSRSGSRNDNKSYGSPDDRSLAISHDVDNDGECDIFFLSGNFFRDARARVFRISRFADIWPSWRCKFAREKNPRQIHPAVKEPSVEVGVRAGRSLT